MDVIGHSATADLDSIVGSGLCSQFSVLLETAVRVSNCPMPVAVCVQLTNFAKFSPVTAVTLTGLTIFGATAMTGAQGEAAHGMVHVDGSKAS